MRNGLDRSCRENQNTHFMFNNVFLKAALFMRKSKNMTETEAPQMMSQYGSYELLAGKARHVRVCTRPRARVLTRTHTQTNK